MNAELVKALATVAKLATATSVNFILFEVVIEAAGESSFQKIMDELTAEDFYSAYPVMGQHCS
jgi:hypothetical protein